MCIHVVDGPIFEKTIKGTILSPKGSDGWHLDGRTRLDRLQIRILGGFSLSSQGGLIGIGAPRFQSFLAWLFLHSHDPQPRTRLAYLLWPEASESQSRNNLRKLLHDLRRAWPEVTRFMEVGRETIAWVSADQAVIDAEEFQRLAGQSESVKSMVAAAALYRGPLLPDCYEDWILPERDRLERLFIDVLRRGMEMGESEGNYRLAISFGENLLSQEPLREDVYLDLMRLHTIVGDRGAAARIYHACATALEQEMGVQPRHDIEEAYRRLLDVPSLPAEPSLTRPRLIGREAEWQTLQTMWRMVLGNRPATALITGDQGIGKTRLTEELLEWARRQQLNVYHASCYSGEETMPYSLATRLLVSRPLPTLNEVWIRELSRLVPELLNQWPNIPAPAAFREPWERRMLFDAIARALLAFRPVMIFVDDLHWCDEDSLSVLRHLLQYEADAQVLLVATARWEEGEAARRMLEGVPTVEGFVEIELSGLNREETGKLVEGIHASAEGGQIEEGDLEALYALTEGNPLYIVEAARSGWGKEVSKRPRSIETAVSRSFGELSQGSKDLLDVAATIGREFPLSVLSMASDQEDSRFVRNLDALWRRRIIRERGVGGYDFSHGQLREVAYSQLSNARRRMLHGKVAAAYRRLGASAGEANL